jgi:enoyl-CoA hydratase
MTNNLVTYTKDEGNIAWITLNRPEKKNAMSRQVLEELQDAYVTYAEDSESRCAILTGAGNSFCTGGDITMFPAINAEVGLKFTYEDGRPHYRFIDSLNKPVIAAVHGYCLAGGFELALQCTFILASQDATFGMEEARLGLIPGYGGTVRLMTSTSPRMAAELLMTAKRISATRALELGIVNGLADDAESVRTLARETAIQIATMSPNAIASVLHVLRSVRTPTDHAFDVEALRTALLFGNSDTQSRVQGVIGSLKSRNKS